jgi:hypothetical protein
MERRKLIANLYIEATIDYNGNTTLEKAYISKCILFPT